VRGQLLRIETLSIDVGVSPAGVRHRRWKIKGGIHTQLGDKAQSTRFCYLERVLIAEVSIKYQIPQRYQLTHLRQQAVEQRLKVWIKNTQK